MVRYISAEKRDTDDFNVPFTHKSGEVVYDAKTVMGPWATMTEASFKKYGERIGIGFGQKYIRNAAGELHKVEG